MLRWVQASAAVALAHILDPPGAALCPVTTATSTLMYTFHDEEDQGYSPEQE